jgi:hypothetical protein
MGRIDLAQPFRPFWSFAASGIAAKVPAITDFHKMPICDNVQIDGNTITK